MSSSIFQPETLVVVLGFVITFVGISVIALYFLRGKRQDLSLLAFGAAALLYGARFLIEIQLGRYTGSPPPRILIILVTSISYLLPVPFSGFLLHVFGKGWKKSMLWVFRLSILFAISGILSDLIQSTPGSLNRLNNILVIIWSVLIMIYTLWPGMNWTPELRIILSGFCIFGLLALNDNLVSLNLTPWTWEGEEYGFIVFLISLGYVAAGRFISGEARLLTMERELEIAKRIQASILPRSLPRLESLEMSARYIPMASVAGDFYDVLPHGEDGLCVLVADVSGHGVGAALIASMLKIAFASQQDHLADPSRVLAGMNESLRGKLEGDFVTAACAYFNTSSGIIRYAAAGHPPSILHRRRRREIEELGDNGLILGPFPEAVYPLTTRAVEAGDRVIMYTDGITEARNGSRVFFGDDEFKNVITDHKDLSAEPFVERLIQGLFFWTGKNSGDSLDDDVTLLVIDRTG